MVVITLCLTIWTECIAIAPRKKAELFICRLLLLLKKLKTIMLSKKTKILKAEYIKEATKILDDSKMEVADKLMALLSYASKVEIATETEILNELIHKIKEG